MYIKKMFFLLILKLNFAFIAKLYLYVLLHVTEVQSYKKKQENFLSNNFWYVILINEKKMFQN